MNGFDEWYAVMPVKKGKAIAKAIYPIITTSVFHTKVRDSDGNMINLSLSATPDELLQAGKVYAYRMIEEDKPRHFIKHANAWLNAGRWMDEEDHIDEYLEKIQRHEANKAKLRIV